MAEEIKVRIGTAVEEAKPRLMEIRGRNVNTGLPKTGGEGIPTGSLVKGNNFGLDVSDILQDSFGSNMARDTNTLGNLRFFDTIVRDVWDDAREKQKEKSDVKKEIKYSIGF